MSLRDLQTEGNQEILKYVEEKHRWRFKNWLEALYFLYLGLDTAWHHLSITSVYTPRLNVTLDEGSRLNHGEFSGIIRQRTNHTRRTQSKGILASIRSNSGWCSPQALKTLANNTQTHSLEPIRPPDHNPSKDQRVTTPYKLAQSLRHNRSTQTLPRTSSRLTWSGIRLATRLIWWVDWRVRTSAECLPQLWGSYQPLAQLLLATQPSVT